MNYMPQFLQTASGLAAEHEKMQEAELLGKLSRESLAHLLTTLNLAESESVYKERLEAELSILEEQGYCGYFLIVADYVRWAKANGIAVGPGRGSGPCSLTGFALGITGIDPIRYQLPFERFINPARGKVPDFDLDFCAERFTEVAAYIQSKYGPDRVAQISSDQSIPQATRLVIGDRPLKELIPVYTNPASSFLATKMTVAQVAEAGLVQFNVLNQKAISNNHRRIRELATLNTLIDINHIPLDDKDTFDLLSVGETPNFDLFDAEYYVSALKTVQPDRFAHLCALIALCHPRLQSSLSLYLERKRDPDSTQFYHPVLENFTADTYGIILYQEQLMHITHEVAGFSMSQGDLFRRMLKNPTREAMSKQMNLFVDGAMENGFSKIEATGLFEHIAISGRNTFNKSHAVAYAMIAYQTAWLKVNYPRDGS